MAELLPRSKIRLLRNRAYKTRRGAAQHPDESPGAAARVEIASWPGYRPTPMVALSGLAARFGVGAVHYKDESGRFGLDSFKALGGAYAVLRVLQREIAMRAGATPTAADLLAGRHRDIAGTVTVTTATDGNHGRSVAWGAHLFGAAAVIYIPSDCSPGREAAIAAYGAEVVRTTEGYDGTVRRCAADADREGRRIVSDTSWDGYTDVPGDVTAGYSVMVEEAIGQLSDAGQPSHVFVQGGVGALAAAVCGHYRARLGGGAPRIVVVEPEGAACLYASAAAGAPVALDGAVHSVMAGLNCGAASPLAWRNLSAGAFAFATVPDAVTAPCMRLLAGSPFGDPPVVAGESAIAGLAALILAMDDSYARETLGLDAGSRIMLLGTEGATDPAIYEALVGRPVAAIRHPPGDG